MAGQSLSKSWLIFRRGIRYSYDYLGMVLATSALGFLWVSHLFWWLQLSVIIFRTQLLWGWP